MEAKCDHIMCKKKNPIVDAFNFDETQGLPGCEVF